MQNEAARACLLYRQQGMKPFFAPAVEYSQSIANRVAGDVTQGVTFPTPPRDTG